MGLWNCCHLPLICHLRIASWHNGWQTSGLDQKRLRLGLSYISAVTSTLANVRLPAFACAALGMQLHVLRAADVPLAVAEREALARLWEREAALSSSALLLDYDEPENSRAVLVFSGERARHAPGGEP